MVWIDDGITVNWNVGSVGTQRFYQVGGGSTLNIGTEASTNNRFVLFNGSANGGADEVATVNLNAENYAADQIWLIGSGNSTTVSTTRALRDLILNVNANQTLSGQIHVGYTFLPRQSKIIIRNGAQVTLSGSLTVGESSISSIDPAHATVQVGDESTTGYLELTNELRLGGGAWTFAKGAVGILDIVNGTTFLNRAGTVELGHGHAANGPLPESKGVINIGANGVLITRSNFAERVGTDAGTGVLNFAGGMLVVDDGSRAEQMSNLIDAGVEVNIMDGGMVLQISPAIAATNSGNFNGDETVDAADYTVWRDNLGGDEAVLPVGSGDGSGTIDAGDYDIWKTAFGKPVDPGVVGSATINAPLLGAGAGGLTVQGGGELILTGANTYVGDTVVDASSLSISSPYLADAADVALLGGAILDLAFADTDTIDQLLFDGAPQAAGTWGAIGSGATHEDSRFTGSGLLMVSTSGAGGGSLGSAVPEPGTAIGAVLMFGTLLGFGRPSHSQTKYFVSSSRPSAKSHSLN
jgi:autotransporter-associated beta strand protein